MKSLYCSLLLFFLMITYSCKQQVEEVNSDSTTSLDTQSDYEAKTTITKVLLEQQNNWNKGDIPAFMEGYWKSEELIFVGRSGVTKGWQQTLDNYLKGYPDTDTMGKLEFEVLELDRLASDIYRMVGTFALQRKEDRPSGIFTLLWRYIDGQWLIVSDHTTG